MEEVMDRFSRAWGRLPAPPKGEGGQEIMTLADWTPTVDIAESETEYVIKVELPEVRKEDVKVAVNQGVLTIQGERKMEREEKNRKYHRVERAYGSFARSFTLPDDVEEDSIRARHKDGMLYLHLGKSESVKPKAVEIKID
jgi:HSP20 family protein